MSKAVAKVASDEALAQLEEGYAQEDGARGIILPRIGLVSQDKTEETGTGKNKKIKIISAAGEFFTEVQSDELDEEGKKKWDRTEIGDSLEAIIFFKRYQLRMYDEATEKYTSSPVYDSKDEVLPLFCDKKEVARGTPEELKSLYEFTGRDGKTRSALEENRILYVLYKGEAYQMNLRGSSMYSLMAYERTVSAPTVVTHFSSEAMQKGDIAWNKMKFNAIRKLNTDEVEKVLELKQSTMDAIAASKAGFAQISDAQKKVNDEFDALPTGGK